MATIRNERKNERLVLVKDNVQRQHANVLAVRDSGSSYLPSVFGQWFQPTTMRGCDHAAARRPDRTSLPMRSHTGSGRRDAARHRAGIALASSR